VIGEVWFVFVSGAGFRVRRRGFRVWCLDHVVLVLFQVLAALVWVEAWAEQLLCFDSGVAVSRLEEVW
jgi:hypothetical protein